MSPIYEPAEDSFLMSDVLDKELSKLLIVKPGLKLLEVGVGSGINLETAKEVGVVIKNILGVDINQEAVDNCKGLGFNCLVSDLFSNVMHKFDVIVFNPPYLPEDRQEPKKSRRETTGGKKGNEIILRFLKQAKEHLTSDGKIFLITSSLAMDINFADLGFEAKVLGEKKLFFERLFCWLLNKLE